MTTRTSVFLTGFALLAMAGAALAHTHLEASNPANGSTVTKVPAEITLTFSEAARVTSFVITKDGGKEQKIAKLPSQMATKITVATPGLAEGKYTVDWRVAGKDGHVMSGKLQFSVGGTPKSGHDGHEGHGSP